jgi:hypothetical protein
MVRTAVRMGGSLEGSDPAQAFFQRDFSGCRHGAPTPSTKEGKMKGTTFLAAAAAALALASPAGAATIEVSGRQKAIDADTAKMTGDLRGAWTTTSFEPVGFEPYFEAKGTEVFEGCIDRRRDRSCKGDPSGTLTLEFGFLGLYESPDPASLVWGTCWHPVVSGTGDFAGAKGVLAFVDSPTANGVSTRYIGSLTLQRAKSSRKARASAARRPAC